jgi:hypothetical protein
MEKWEDKLKAWCSDADASDVSLTEKLTAIVDEMKSIFSISTLNQFEKLFKTTIKPVLISGLKPNEHKLMTSNCVRKSDKDKTPEEKESAKKKKLISNKIGKWKKLILELWGDLEGVYPKEEEESFFYTELYESLTSLYKKYLLASKKEKAKYLSGSEKNNLLNYINDDNQIKLIDERLHNIKQKIELFQSQCSFISIAKDFAEDCSLSIENDISYKQIDELYATNEEIDELYDTKNESIDDELKLKSDDILCDKCFIFISNGKLKRIGEEQYCFGCYEIVN